MKRFLWLLPLAVLLFAGFRTTGYRSDLSLVGSYYPVSDTLYRWGSATNRWKEVWALRLMGTDGSKADSFSFFDDGTYTKWDTDNTKAFMTGATYRFIMSGNNFTGGSDTVQTVGTDANRLKEVWGLRHCWSDGTKADSGKIYDDGTNSILLSDNPFKIDHLLADTLQVQIQSTGSAGTTGYATMFVDTTGTDSIIVMVGSTRRGIAIE